MQVVMLSQGFPTVFPLLLGKLSHNDRKVLGKGLGKSGKAPWENDLGKCWESLGKLWENVGRRLFL